MKKYLNDLLAEKNIDLEETLEVMGDWGVNFIPVGCVVEAILMAQKAEQEKIRKILVQIDFMNGDILHFFKHLAKAMAM